MILVIVLRGREEFEHVFRHGKAHHTKYFIFRVFRRPAERTRVAIVVSKKVSAKATERNRLRRRIREYIRRSESAIQGRDIIIQTKQGIAALTRKDLYQELERMLKNIGDA